MGFIGLVSYRYGVLPYNGHNQRKKHILTTLYYITFPLSGLVLGPPQDFRHSTLSLIYLGDLHWLAKLFCLTNFPSNGIKRGWKIRFKYHEMLSYRKSLYEDEKSTPPLYVMAPSRMSEYLMPYHCKFESILQSLVQVKNEHLLPSPLESGKNYWPHTGANKVRSSAFMLSFIDRQVLG